MVVRCLGGGGQRWTDWSAAHICMRAIKCCTLFVCLSVCLSRAYDLLEVREAQKLKFIGDIMLLNDYQVQIRKEPAITK